MLDLEVLQVLLDPLCNKVRAVVRDDCMQDPIPGDDVVPNKLLCRHDCDYLVGGCFHPLGKIFDRYQDVAMTVGGCWMYGANDIDPSGGERPWRRHAVQLLWGRVYEVLMDLAAMASAHKLAVVCLHG